MAKKHKAKQPAGKKEAQTTSQASGVGRSQKGSRRKVAKTDLSLPLNKTNYGLMGLGFLLVILGFILMSGDENIYGFRKLTLSVITCVAGYVLIGYGIMKRSDVGESHEQEEKQSVS